VLALCARYPPIDASLTAWSSGTGFAGVFGYLWVALLRVYIGLSFRATLLLANVMPVAFLLAYWLGLRRAAGGRGRGARDTGSSGSGEEAVGYGRLATAATGAGGGALVVQGRMGALGRAVVARCAPRCAEAC
jgi:hypothetical protein